MERRAISPLCDVLPAEIAVRDVCAVVVAFFPDGDFEQRLLAVLPQVTALVVVDNTPGGACARRLQALEVDGVCIHLIENLENVGIAAALNQGVDYALELHYSWVLTLDQDTQCYPDMVAILMRVYAVCTPKPVVVGGNYVDPRKGALTVGASAEGAHREVKTVITSGSLVNARLAYEMGGFREDYFIDQVDHEFCLRVRSHGGLVVISRQPVMTHSVGGAGGVWVPFLGILPAHPPLRKYYIARNSVVIIATYWRREPGWCLRRSVRLVLGLCLMAILEEQKLAKVRAFAAGVVDGIFRRMGSCWRTWLR